uniref:Uncharacterized protein n=1 Tax=Trieres chinensis TaxID=1514140 RepID=A0A7S2A3R3_TRICV
MVNATKRAYLAAFALAAMCADVHSFQTTRLSTERTSAKVVTYGYIPSGFTKEQWEKFQKKEKVKKANLGRMGPKGFQSRSMQSFQEALERGEAKHLMPVFNAKEKVAKRQLRQEDIPYMQRGGAWDNSDVKGSKKKRWLDSDKQYASGGFRKEQSVSIFGYGEGLDWTGSKSKRGPESAPGAAAKFAKNYKAPNVNDLKKGGNTEPKKKFFGLF